MECGGRENQGWVSVGIVAKKYFLCTLGLVFQSYPLKVSGSYSENYSNIQMLKGKKQKQAGILLNAKK